MPAFSEVTRIEAAIKNKSSKELEWSLWYCQMRQAVPSARPADLKYWRGIEALVKETMAPPAAAKAFPVKKKKAGRGLGMGPVAGGDES
ncbi:hypothetical protein [Tunturiibacter gelidiferens]|uniref:hypothetical protein n=1 Tax=Tunturiibacter gelidiferens TaxID=3069689 RepID=UPI003D9B080C